MCYLPSVVATATMMHVVNSVEPRLGVEYQNQLLGILGIDKVIKRVLRILKDLNNAVFIYLAQFGYT